MEEDTNLSYLKVFAVSGKMIGIKKYEYFYSESLLPKTRMKNILNEVSHLITSVFKKSQC